MKLNRFAWCLGLLFVASTCFAQMYIVNDLGTFGGSSSTATGINNLGQVVGIFSDSIGGYGFHGFRTAPNSPINPATDDLGSTGCGESLFPTAINNSGQVVGNGRDSLCLMRGFRTAPNSPVNPATDDLGWPFSGPCTESVWPLAINDSGQVVGQTSCFAFSTGPNGSIHILNNLDPYGIESFAWGINALGQVVGEYTFDVGHAFRTAPNSPIINPSTDDLGPGVARAINAFGQVVGDSSITGGAFRTAPNSPINPATDALGSLGGYSFASAINVFGEVVGASALSVEWPPLYHPFIYSTGPMYDLNNLIQAGYSCELVVTVIRATDINDAGQIAANAICNGQNHAVRLDPIYQAFVQRPINADGSSVFSAKRGAVPVKFAVTQYGTQPTCTLPATISISRTGGGTLASVDESTYSMSADSGSNFRIDSTACQYIYNLAASSLGVGTYRVDISINGIMVGHAVFALK